VCFSAAADLVAGVIVGGAGIDALRHVQDRREVPLAALPVIFGVHQIIETFNWWGLEGRAPEHLGTIAMWAYLVIAFGVVPIMVPIAVHAGEPDPGRRGSMVPFVVLGAVVAVVLMSELVAGPVGAEVACRYIAYGVDLGYGGPMTALYVVATCVPLLLSSNRRIVVFGVLNLPVVATLGFLLADGVISLWCAWAALTSLAIVIHLRAAAGSGVAADRADPVDRLVE